MSRARRGREGGFTLIELMVAMLLAINGFQRRVTLARTTL